MSFFNIKPSAAMAKHLHYAYFFTTTFLSQFLASIGAAITHLPLRVLACGPIPAHIAIIMDGNRRFARRRHIDKRSAHVSGYDRLIQVLRNCLELGVRIVTLYAFSIDNFQRSPEEVSDLMELLQEKLELLVTKEQLVRDYGVRIRILGDLTLLPEGLRITALKAMEMTSSNESAILNVCIAYTSTQEIVQAIQKIRVSRTQGCHEVLQKEEIESNLYTGACPAPDILLRTSGETRLSNFLLWQCSNSYLYFCNALWPDFSFWNLCWVIIQYQRAYPFLSRHQRPSL